MAIVWNGVNAVQGAQCVYVMLHALSPHMARIPNVMGAGSALDSGGMVGLAVFWIVTCIFLLRPIPKMRGLVYAKLVVFIVSAVAMCAWTLTRAGGAGQVARQGGTAQGSERAWLMVRFFFLGAANCATFASNAADFQRYARRPNDVLLGNLVGFPLSNFIVCVVGNLVASSSQVLYGSVIWNPVTYLDQLQTTAYTPGDRAGCFFIAACFAYCAVFSSIFENSLPAGNDIAALFPRFFTVRRGFFVCQIISIAINPWYLLSSASVFISFLSSYQIFLSAITGVLLCHYYIISRGYLAVDDLFTSDKFGAYHYFHGWNWRAYLAYILGIAPNFYGFLNNMGVAAPLGLTHAYYVAYEIGLIVSFGVFWVANTWSKPAIIIPLSQWHEPKDSYVRPEEIGEVTMGEDPDPDPEEGRSVEKATAIVPKASQL
jgi:nucleobase:cation symporter-1, NCS1 family